ncbi:uncharacterized protein TM35_000351040 [Trypanosoma theileri]|uniref:Uncharacterized protein n=1 Tax=Trypanosoma theileri TaxID=67003 RepID=A0A1X0NMK9_9TRYP|nr:uncharacterized protein TM35_000351040 [Trypanosoma theileri]ORC85360.1 hypothetical protein TM35_000351040 [Trypanosoma theileri]
MCGCFSSPFPLISCYHRSKELTVTITSTMFIQLRRVVYLLVLLQCCTCVVRADFNEKDPATCLNDTDFRVAERQFNGTLHESDRIFLEGEACLKLWKDKVDDCNAYVRDYRAAAHKVTEVVSEIAAKNPSKDQCGTVVADLVQQAKVRVDEFKRVAARSSDKVELARNTKTICISSAVGNLLAVVPKIEEAMVHYKSYLDDVKYKVCKTDWRTKRVQEVEANHTKMKEVHKQLVEVMPEKHQLCRVDGGSVAPVDEVKAALKTFQTVCGKGLEGVEVNPVKEASGIWNYTKGDSHKVAVIRVVDGKVVEGADKERPLTETENETFMVRVMGNGKVPEMKEANVRKIKEDFVTAKKAVVVEREQAEQRRLEEEREKEARRKQEEEQRRLLAAEQARKAKEEQDKKKSEEQAKRERDENGKKDAEVKAKEEEAKRVAEEARKAKEEAKRVAAEEAKKKKDGSVSPALVHSSLILLVLSVLGCTLVC